MAPATPRKKVSIQDKKESPETPRSGGEQSPKKAGKPTPKKHAAPTPKKHAAPTPPKNAPTPKKTKKHGTDLKHRLVEKKDAAEEHEDELETQLAQCRDNREQKDPTQTQKVFSQIAADLWLYCDSLEAIAHNVLVLARKYTTETNPARQAQIYKEVKESTQQIKPYCDKVRVCVNDIHAIAARQKKGGKAREASPAEVAMAEKLAHAAEERQEKVVKLILQAQAAFDDKIEGHIKRKLSLLFAQEAKLGPGTPEYDALLKGARNSLDKADSPWARKARMQQKKLQTKISDYDLVVDSQLVDDERDALDQLAKVGLVRPRKFFGLLLLRPRPE